VGCLADRVVPFTGERPERCACNVYSDNAFVRGLKKSLQTRSFFAGKTPNTHTAPLPPRFVRIDNDEH
jgi:hypothetical protein